MKQQKIIVLAVSAAMGLFSTSANAAFNVYKKDGLQLDISGKVSAEYKKDSGKNSYEYKDNWFVKENGNWQRLFKGYESEVSDERTRLGLNPGASWVNFRGTQTLNSYWEARAEVGLGYYRSGGSWTEDDIYLSTANVQLEREKVASITLGKQWLHGAYINRVGTYAPLTSKGNSAVRFDYKGISDFTFSYYRLFPSHLDTRQKSTLETSGWGSSVDYLYRFAPDHTARFGLGYSYNNYKHYENTNWTYKNSKAVLGSVEYTYRRAKLGVDLGQGIFNNGTQYLSKNKVKNWGVKLEYAFTPRFRMAAVYGEQKSKKETSNLTFDQYQHWKTVENAGLSYQYMTLNHALFKEVKQQRYYVRADYDWRSNVTFFARADWQKTHNYTETALFSKRKYREFSAGMAISF